jgi:nitrogen PTS system EIIA component
MLESYQSIITTEELAEILRLNERTVLKLVKEGRLPAMKIANQFRFSKGKIIEWIESQMSDYSDRLLSDMEKGISEMPIIINKILIPENIIININSGNKVDAIKELIDAADNSGFVKNKEELLKHLYIRESHSSTGVGNGIAFPHPRTPSKNLVNKTLIAIGIIKDGIDFEAIDGIPVKIIVLLVVPALSLHLQILSHITRIFYDENTRSDVIYANDPEKIINIIKKREESLAEK